MQIHKVCNFGPFSSEFVDSYLLLNYLNTIRARAKSFSQVKLLLLGECGDGKSSLLKRMKQLSSTVADTLGFAANVD